MLDDTIAAIATAPGGAACGIVRVAGKQTFEVLSDCFRAKDGRSLADVRTATCLSGLFELRDLARQLPCDLYLWPDDRSYCRTPMAEIHTLGSPPLLAVVLRTLCAGGQARAAEPGEFTLRAFLSGRIDLAQAEAVLGVIDARGQQDFQVALSQLSGGLSRPLDRLRDTLLETLAHLEAGLDFVEEDIEFISAGAVTQQLSAALGQVEALVGQVNSRMDAALAIRVVLRGRPNAGKSSLFNAMVSRSNQNAAALVSPQPGTTRDYLVARLMLGGIPCDLIDTAGLDDRQDLPGPDGLAQSMSRQQIAHADLEICCIDSADHPTQSDASCQPGASRMVVLTKCDLHQVIDASYAAAIETSAATGKGLEDLERAIRQAISNMTANDLKVVAATAERCRASLAAAAASLREAQQLNQSGGAEELLAAEIRSALHSVGQVTGAVYTDDILDRIFSRFCIGK